MEIITQEQIKQKKQSDTIVIYGSGGSINDLGAEGVSRLSNYDSIGFNFSCKSGIPSTFYILREQTTTNRGYSDEYKKDLVADINKNNPNTTLLVISMLTSGHVWKGRRGWLDHHSSFSNEGMILNEIYFEEKYYRDNPHTPNPNKKLIVNAPKMNSFCDQLCDTDLFSKGILYYSCTMSNALHFSLGMGYKRIILAGVDLYDHRYFWLPKNVLREQAKRKKRGINTKHKTFEFTTACVDTLSKRNNIDLYVINPKSVLNQYIPVWDWGRHG